MLKFDRAGFLIFALVFYHVTVKLAETSVVKSRPSVQYGVNLSVMTPAIISPERLKRESPNFGITEYPLVGVVRVTRPF